MCLDVSVVRANVRANARANARVCGCVFVRRRKHATFICKKLHLDLHKNCFRHVDANQRITLHLMPQTRAFVIFMPFL